LFSKEGSLGVSFFERLGTDIKNGQDGHDTIAHIAASIKRNITSLLNTRAGESQSCPELGLFDFNDASSGSFDLSTKIKIGVELVIEKFEPRLFDLQITALHDEASPFNLRFHIQGSVRLENQRQKIELDLVLDRDRKYRIS